MSNWYLFLEESVDLVGGHELAEVHPTLDELVPDLCLADPLGEEGEDGRDVVLGQRDLIVGVDGLGRVHQE